MSLEKSTNKFFWIQYYFVYSKAIHLGCQSTTFQGRDLFSEIIQYHTSSSLGYDVVGGPQLIYLSNSANAARFVPLSINTFTLIAKSIKLLL
jgi:hypothetical protein